MRVTTAHFNLFVSFAAPLVLLHYTTQNEWFVELSFMHTFAHNFPWEYRSNLSSHSLSIKTRSSKENSQGETGASNPFQKISLVFSGSIHFRFYHQVLLHAGINKTLQNSFEFMALINGINVNGVSPDNGSFFKHPITLRIKRNGRTASINKSFTEKFRKYSNEKI